MKNLCHKQIMLGTVEVAATAQSSWCSHNSHTTGTKCTRVCEYESDDESRSKSQMHKNGQTKTDTLMLKLCLTHLVSNCFCFFILRSCWTLPVCVNLPQNRVTISHKSLEKTYVNTREYDSINFNEMRCNSMLQFRVCTDHEMIQRSIIIVIQGHEEN